MSRYMMIQKELTAANDARFQQICDAFLVSEYTGDLQSPGAVEAKGKTRKGKPDSFIP
jgi:hypothetical protein